MSLDFPTGMVIPLRSIPGAQSVREVYRPGETIPEHRHQRVGLTIPLLGAFTAASDLGEEMISGAAAVIHPPGSAHAAFVSRRGLETVGFQFDADWLRHIGLSGSVDRTFYWKGGKAGAAAVAFATRWMDRRAGAADLARATFTFLSMAQAEQPAGEPRWISRVDRAVASERPFKVRELARDLDLHPAWLLQAYRASRGEGLPQARRRGRVETAVRLLRDTALPLAQIACHAGFCDQSHMNRAFRAVVGRSPLAVRDSLRH